MEILSVDEMIKLIGSIQWECNEPDRKMQVQNPDDDDDDDEKHKKKR